MEILSNYGQAKGDRERSWPPKLPRLGLLAACSTILITSGCVRMRTPWELGARPSAEHMATGGLCYSPHYVLLFKGKERGWDVNNYLWEPACVLTHHATRSEIWIFVRRGFEVSKAQTRASYLQSIAREFYEVLHAQDVEESTLAIKHRRRYYRTSTQLEHLARREEVSDETEFLYLKSRFTGRRHFAEWYDPAEVADQVMYITDMRPELDRPPSGHVLVVIMAMPVNTGLEEKTQLMELLESNLRSLTILRAP
jgi:hypothetical protein